MVLRNKSKLCLQQFKRLHVFRVIETDISKSIPEILDTGDENNLRLEISHSFPGATHDSVLMILYKSTMFNVLDNSDFGFDSIFRKKCMKTKRKYIQFLRFT